MKALLLTLACIVAWAIPASAQSSGSFSVVVTGSAGNVTDAQVSVILKSGAYQDAKFADGKYTCQPTEECTKVFVGAPGHECGIEKVPRGAAEVSVALKPSTTKNSAVIHRRGPLPGIDGDINPILDNLSRLYLYTSKIGIKQGSKAAPQPVKFTLKRDLDLVSPTGRPFKLWIIDITTQVSLVEYTMPQ